MLLRNSALSVLEKLSKDLRSDGLKDELDKRVIKNDYATAFYALACALAYNATHRAVWLERALSALDSELEVIHNYKSTSGVFRWEFKNYALLRIYSALQKKLPKHTLCSLRRAILRWKNVGSFQSNWLAMRALNYSLRHSLFGNKTDKIRAELEMWLLLRRQDPDGFFWDDVRQNSMQYHAYTLALIYQYYETSGDKRARKAFLRGVDLAARFISKDGDFNFYGRGEKQLFGYVSLIYALCGAHNLTRNDDYLALAGKVFQFIDRHRDGPYPLVLGEGEHDRSKWHPYNHKSTYNAFLAAYFLQLPDAEPVLTHAMALPEPANAKQLAEDYFRNKPFRIGGAIAKVIYFSLLVLIRIIQVTDFMQLVKYFNARKGYYEPVRRAPE